MNTSGAYERVETTAFPLPGHASPKILLYSHDTFGLGNIRRSLLLGELLGTTYPRSAVLLITGSPMIHAFRIPARMDYVKLPCVDRVDAEEYRPRFLTSCSAEVRETRGGIIERTALGFAPDLVIVDKRAAGIDGELLPALEALRASTRPPRIVLGLRDILDAPEKTRSTLRSNGSFELIDRLYDEVWIYGSRAVFDAVREYDFPESVARRTRYCGYLRRRSAPRHVNGGRPRVLVTTGGGADGNEIVATYLAALRTLPVGEIESVVIFGPQLPAAESDTLRRLAGDRPDVRLMEFEADMTAQYAEADVVVSMAGYNTVCELLSAGVRGVLVPRAEPVQEQLIRARRLAARDLFRMVEPSQLTPEHLLETIFLALAGGVPQPSSIDLEGLTRIRARVDRLLKERL